MKTLDTGALAPDFELPDDQGRAVRLTSTLREGPVVLFFYPAAMTAGCTREACHFRDLAAEFEAAGARRLGISRDPVARQRRFASTHAFDYPLLSDESGAVAAAYGVRRRLLTAVRRATFVIGSDRKVQAVVTSELDMRVHAERALSALRDAG